MEGAPTSPRPAVKIKSTKRVNDPEKTRFGNIPEGLLDAREMAAFMNISLDKFKELKAEASIPTIPLGKGTPRYHAPSVINYWLQFQTPSPTLTSDDL